MDILEWKKVLETGDAVLHPGVAGAGHNLPDLSNKLA